MMQNKVPATDTYKRLLSYIKDVKMAFIFGVIGNLIYAGLDVYFISLIETLTDEGLVKGDMSVMKMAPFVIILIMLFRGGAAVISSYCMAFVAQTTVKQLRFELVTNYLKLPSQFFDKNASGQLISKVTFNTQQVANASSDAITKLFREGGSIIYAVIYLFYTNWRLASIFFISAPIIGFVVYVTSKRFKKVSKNIQSAMGGVTQVSQEIVDGYKVVKTFGGETYEENRFENAINKNRQQNMKMTLTKAISVPLIQFIAAMALAIVIFFATIEFEKGALTAGEFIVMLSMIMYLLKPLKVISNLNSDIQQGIAAAQDIFEVIDAEKEIDTGKKELIKSPHKIEFENVEFRYTSDQSPVVDLVSFVIEQGQTVALVGRSGSGKSTITNLLLRFYNIEKGTIKINDDNIDEFTLRSLRNNIAYVSQQVCLFNDSVAANIAYGQSEIDQEKLYQAAEKAHALEFIAKMPNGFDSLIGEDGSSLSGGQRQRIAIARAIYKDCPIIILDEATSALDTESERHIQAALDALTQNRTTLVIAHRLSTIENADKIIVMEEGKIVEQGDHQYLLNLNGAYSRLHSIQFSEE